MFLVVATLGVSTLPFAARLVCATHRDLEAEVAAGRFREGRASGKAPGNLVQRR